MTLFHILLMGLATTNPNTVTQKNCQQWYDRGQHSQVISQCEQLASKSIEMAYIHFASLMFMEVSKDRINYIFHNGKKFGSTMYKSQMSKPLYTNLEKYYLRQYFEKLKSFADKGVAQAQMLTAKALYINLFIFKQDEKGWSSSETYREEKEGIDQYYLPNLKKYLLHYPEHAETLFLLGEQGVQVESTLSNGSYKRYYSVIDEELYQHLIHSYELGYGEASEYIEGVENWNRHLSSLTQNAKSSDSESLFKLGIHAFHGIEHGQSTKEEAINHFKQAATLGHLEALQWLNSIYGMSASTKEKYMSTLQQLVERNDSKAMIRLGDIYFCNKQTDDAKAMYDKAKTLKDPLAKYSLDDLLHGTEPSSGCR